VRQRLAIVGAGITWRQAPFDDSEYTIWTTGSVSKILPRVDEIFDIHGHDTVQPDEVLNAKGSIVWLQDVRPTVPNSRKFPIDKLILEYGNIFNCSMVMMLGYALWLGYDHIELYGVDLADNTEYAKYRATFMYLVGRARGAGKKVIISEGSLLFRDCKTYGYEQRGVMAEHVTRKEKELIERLAKLTRDYEGLGKEIEYLRGALDMSNELRKLYEGE